LDVSAQLCYEHGFPTSADVFEVEMHMLVAIGRYCASLFLSLLQHFFIFHRVMYRF
jgi:hypothetical protein